MSAGPAAAARPRVWLRRTVFAVAAIAAGVQLGLTIIFWRVMSRDLHMNDFGKFYYSARAFLDGGDMYGPTVATAVPFGEGATREFWNMNPPHFHLLVLPLARLAPESALAVWFAGSFFCLFFSVLLIARELSIQWTPRTVFVAVLAILLPSATGMVVLTGQVTFLLMLPMTLAWIAARRGLWPRAAIWLGVASSVKPFLGIFWIYLLLRREFAAAIAMAGVVLAALLAGVSVFGLDAYSSWRGVVARVDWVWGPMNASLAALLVRTFGDNPTFAPLLHVPALVRIGAPCLALGIAGYTFWHLVRRPSHLAEDGPFAALLLTALLVSPLGWMYYIGLAAGPITALVMARRGRLTPFAFLCVGLAIPGLLVPHLVTAVAAGHPLGGLTIGSVYTWSIVGMWLGVLSPESGSARHRLSFVAS